MFRCLILAMVLLTFAACGAPRAVQAPVNDPTGILVQNGWTLSGGADASQFTVPAPVSNDPAAQQALDASKAIGLDFAAQAGKQLTLQSFPIIQTASGGQGLRGNVLMDGSNVVGAWLAAGDNVYALNTKP